MFSRAHGLDGSGMSDAELTVLRALYDANLKHADFTGAQIQRPLWER